MEGKLVREVVYVVGVYEVEGVAYCFSVQYIFVCDGVDFVIGQGGCYDIV